MKIKWPTNKLLKLRQRYFRECVTHNIGKYTQI